MTPAQQQMLDAAAREARRAHAAGYVLPLHMDVEVISSLVAALQLALRHPRNTGRTAGTVRAAVDSIIQRVEADGYPALATLLRLGNDPENDV